MATAALCAVGKAAKRIYGCAESHAGDIRGWWIWAYWVNPVTYSMRALTLNEFTAPRWAIPDPQNPSKTLGAAVLQTYGYDHAHWWRFAPIGILCGYIILLNVIIALALRFLSGAHASPLVTTAKRLHLLCDSLFVVVFMTSWQ